MNEIKLLIIIKNLNLKYISNGKQYKFVHYFYGAISRNCMDDHPFDNDCQFRLYYNFKRNQIRRLSIKEVPLS